tara:strand:- start:447 stop:770 length:324 start_codon:yes stop_codon:yes gene_type:complete
MTTGEIATKVITWCQMQMGLHCKVELRIGTSNELGCWGMSWEDEMVPNTYHMSIAEDQSLRDFVATVTHEMVHIHQWVKGKYWGDGEREATKKQFRLADRVWKEGVI